MLSVPTTIEGLSIFGHQDYMHLAWRVRVQLLSPKKEWEIGPGQRVGVAPLDSLFKGGKKLLNGRDRIVRERVFCTSREFCTLTSTSHRMQGSASGCGVSAASSC